MSGGGSYDDPKMDPMFGLPCINESRAMDNARYRNHRAEKMLAQKFQSLDLAKRSVSEKLISSRSAIKDFRESLDYNPTKHALYSRRGISIKRATPGSMSLREFDKIINEARDRKTTQIPPSVHQLCSPSAKESNPNSFIMKKDNSVVLNTFNSDSSHIVDLELYDRCLPINRQKHAMRDAWERATTDDMHHKARRGQMSLTPEHFRASKNYDVHLNESLMQARSLNTKPKSRKK